MGDIFSYYIKGRKEGYFNIRLEPILNEDRSTREVYLKGYQLGKAVRKKEELGETEEEKQLYISNRTAYITSIGFKAAHECYPVDDSSLGKSDRAIYEMGYNAGKVCNNLEHDGIVELNNFQRQITLVRNE